MGSRMKKMLAIALSVMCMVAFSFTGVFAAGSPEEAQPVQSDTASKPVSEYNTHTNGTADLVGLSNKSLKTKVIYQTVTVKGVKYKVVSVKAGAFSGCKKLKTIKIKSKYLKKFDKKAFKGLKKSQIKKIKVKVTKKMSKKDFKKLKKALKKAGIKAKNIKRVKM